MKIHPLAVVLAATSTIGIDGVQQDPSLVVVPGDEGAVSSEDVKVLVRRDPNALLSLCCYFSAPFFLALFLRLFSTPFFYALVLRTANAADP